MTKTKVCGLRRAEDILFANALRPDYIGFVFAQKSRRYVSPEEARALREGLKPGIAAVGVFVNAPVALVAQLLEQRVIDLAQLHGQEDEDYISALRAKTNAPIVQAFRVDTAQDVARAKGSSADLILLDSGAGGTGESFDWSLLRDIDRPFFLAGGLSPANVARAIADTRPYGVDVSSGVESGGRKDVKKMTAFLQAVRTYSKEEQR